MALNIDQITTYPLFTFSYSSGGKFLSLQKAKFPNFFKRKKFYKIIDNYFLNNDLEKVSVWGFKKPKRDQYSSVTREVYIGLGAGAGTNLSKIFYFNTFFVNEYINTLKSNQMPIAVQLKKNIHLSNFYWFYWKLYQTRFFIEDFNRKFKKNKKVYFLFKIFKLLKFCIIKNYEIVLTQRGSFWIHLAQNFYIINYVDKIWSILKKDPWPKKIDF